jgi:hypothetical protein
MNSIKILGQFKMVLSEVIVKRRKELRDMIGFHVFQVADGGLLEANHVFG